MKKQTGRPTKRTREPKSSTRDEQAAQTTRRLLEAAADFLATHPASELTLPKLARLAGVTPPTAYTNFKTVDNLLHSLYDWLQPQLGTRDPLVAPERLHDVPRERFPRFDAHGGLLRSIWASASWSRHRSASRQSYIVQARENLRSVAPDQGDEALLLAMGPIMAFSYPPMWQWLRDVVGLTEEQTEEAAAWAIEALVAALRERPPTVASKPARRPRKGAVESVKKRRTKGR
jgi:AcrR family transcriptional regulator